MSSHCPAIHHRYFWYLICALLGAAIEIHIAMPRIAMEQNPVIMNWHFIALSITGAVIGLIVAKVIHVIYRLKCPSAQESAED